jgi:hypothetical protein
MSSNTSGCVPCHHPGYIEQGVTTIAPTIHQARPRSLGNCKNQRHTQHPIFRSRHLPTSEGAQPHTDLHTLLDRLHTVSRMRMRDSFYQFDPQPRNCTRKCTARSNSTSMQLVPFLPSLRDARHIYLHQRTYKTRAIYIASRVSVSVTVHFPFQYFCEVL